MPEAGRQETFQLFRDCIVNGFLNRTKEQHLEDLSDSASFSDTLDTWYDIYYKEYCYLLLKWEEEIAKHETGDGPAIYYRPNKIEPD